MQLHVITVHWQDPYWINVQSRYLKAFAGMPFRVYGAFTGIDSGYDKHFDYVLRSDIESHPEKLNLLARYVIEQSVPDEDLLLFMDGDAFPVSNLADFATARLSQSPLLAVQRLENMNDCQPHPCFCLTTAGFWKEIQGDWHPGHAWKNSQGALTTDVGGNLLGLLEKHKVKWHPMLRSNRVNLHPLWFGLYEDVVYHHGAGFRPSVSRLDHWEMYPRFWKWYRKLEKLPDCRATRILRGKLNPSRFGNKGIAEKNRKLSEQVLAKIEEDFTFFQMFQPGSKCESG